MIKRIIGIITKTTDPYVPTQVPCIIYLNNKGKITSVHRVDNGSGTFLFSHYDQMNTTYVPINNKKQDHEI